MGKLENIFHKSAGYASSAKEKIIDVTSDVLSAPARLKARKTMRQADSDVKILKEARAYDNAPNFNDDGSVTDAFKVRSLARGVKDRLNKKNKNK